MRCFCELLRLAASSEAFDAEQQVESKGEALQKLFDEMHSEVGKLRIPEARSNLKQHLEEEARQRRATAARLRAAAADARQQIKDMLAGPDAPPYTDHEESEEAVVERAVLISDSIRAHEAAEHARLCLEGKAPPEALLDEPESLEDGLQAELVDAVKEARRRRGAGRGAAGKGGSEARDLLVDGVPAPPPNTLHRRERACATGRRYYKCGSTSALFSRASRSDTVVSPPLGGAAPPPPPPPTASATATGAC